MVERASVDAKRRAPRCGGACLSDNEGRRKGGHKASDPKGRERREGGVRPKGSAADRYTQRKKRDRPKGSGVPVSD